MSFFFNLNLRWYSAISFASQFLRVPMLISLVVHLESLSLYFLVTLASIPFQFFALEILQYRSKGKTFKASEQVIILIIFLVTIVHVGHSQGYINLLWYLGFGISLLVHGAAIGHVRNAKGARGVLYFECISSVMATCGVIAAATLVPELSMSQAIISVLAASNLLFGIVILRSTKAAPIISETDSSVQAGIAPLTAILATTQLERLVVSIGSPEFLTVISLAGGLVQGWRKVAMDDAIVFESIRTSSVSSFAKVIDSEVRRGCIVFLLPACLALLSYFLSPYMFAWTVKHGILKSLSLEMYRSVPLLLCVYLTSLPTGIIMINLLRSGRVRVPRIAWAYLVSVIIIEFFLLSPQTIFSRGLGIVWTVIGLTASINVLFFFSFKKQIACLESRYIIVASFAYLSAILLVICQKIY